MNDKDKHFIERYEELLNKGYCNCNEMNCIDNNSPRRILDIVNQLQSNWNSLRKENKALRLLLNWAEECDWGFDNFRDDDVIDWEEFEEETEDMDYIESMIFYAKKYLDKMNELEGVDKK